MIRCHQYVHLAVQRSLLCQATIHELQQTAFCMLKLCNISSACAVTWPEASLKLLGYQAKTVCAPLGAAERIT